MDAMQQIGGGEPGPASIDHVLETIQGALSIDNATRSAAEGLLQRWEADASPGFLVSLLRIVEQSQAIDGAIRLLAAVIAKNTVGASWRKTLGTREWSRVPDDEKHLVREATLSLLLTDSSDRVATQLTLLITNISRFDFPGRSQDLLTRLLGAASEPSVPPPARLRALKTLTSVLAGLSTKRFVIEAPSAAGAPGITALRTLSQHINAERELFKSKLAEAFQPLSEVFSRHVEAFISCQPGWEWHAPMAKAAAAAAAELLVLGPVPPEQLPKGAELLLRHMHAASLALMHPGSEAGGQVAMAAAGAYVQLSPAQQIQWSELGGRVCERMSRVAIAALDQYPIPFAALLPPFLELHVEHALIALDAATVRGMRAKRRVLMVRFIAKALLNPFYRPEWAAAPIPERVPDLQRMQLVESRARASVAHQALARMLSLANGPCAPLVEAVISKYVALTPEELDEWQADPESYARSMDVESGPDADTPRPIGVGLLLCMLERGGDDVVTALLMLASRMQAVSPPTQESVLVREACYRCIGEGYNHVQGSISFQVWYENELRPQLVGRLPQLLAGSQDLSSSVLQARALWLLGVCGQNLDAQQWCGGYQLLVRHMEVQDLVVALTAVSGALALTAAIMDDQQALEQYDAATKPKTGMPNMMEALQLRETSAQVLEGGEEVDEVIAETRKRVEQRLQALGETMSAALGGCFKLLERLSEVESMVRVLQLVSVLVEVMGTRILPHLGVVAGALPHIWATASSHLSKHSVSSQPSSQGTGNVTLDTGAVVRLHSALIAVLTHLVGKLRAVAVRDTQIAGVVFPLLDFSTSLGSQESECLVEEAFRLWNTTLCSLPEVPQQLLSLLPHLGALLSRGKDNASVFPIIESYLLLGAAQALNPLSSAIQATLEATVKGVTEAVVAASASSLLPHQPPNGPLSGGGGPVKAKPGPGGVPVAPGGGAARALSAEMANEAMAAAALADVMLQLFPADAPALLASTFRAMAALVAHPDVPLQGVNVKVLNVMEGFLEVLGRLLLASPGLYPALLEGLPESASARFLDRWLNIASTRFLEEVIGVKTMAMLGRFRRRIATAALGSVITAGTCNDVYEPLKLVRVVSLSLQALLDDPDFYSDLNDLDELDFKSDLCEDYVMVRRLSITRADPIRSMRLPEKVRAMLLGLAGNVGGEAALQALVQQHASPRSSSQLAQVLQGNLEFSDSGDDELLYGNSMLPSRDGMTG
ncbi:hypothetical protein FOA52_016121 [Chlamydomonas sp. UWO 241]|nr:hypothetical protein FOA52_016121 [Chlamydomonas sp. UWO 241]